MQIWILFIISLFSKEFYRYGFLNISVCMYNEISFFATYYFSILIVNFGLPCKEYIQYFIQMGFTIMVC